MKLSRRPQTVRAPILGEHEGFAEARLIYLRDFTFRAWRFTVRISLFFKPFYQFAAHSIGWLILKSVYLLVTQTLQTFAVGIHRRRIHIDGRRYRLWELRQ